MECWSKGQLRRQNSKQKNLKSRCRDRMSLDDLRHVVLEIVINHHATEVKEAGFHPTIIQAVRNNEAESRLMNSLLQPSEPS
jgi:hypothetical protein